MCIKFSFGTVNPEDGSLSFRSSRGENFYVMSLNKGVMVIKPILDTSLESLAETISSCFIKESNFYGLRAIEFDFNGIYLSIDKENASVEKILNLFREKSRKIEGKIQKRSRKIIKMQKRSKSIAELVNLADNSIKIELKDSSAEKLWNTYLKHAKSGYEKDILRFAELWAKYMQYLMNKHSNVNVKQIAQKASTDVKTSKMDCITRSMRVRATSILIEVWKHGDDLIGYTNDCF